MLNLIVDKKYVLPIFCILLLGFTIPAYADLQLIQPDESLGVTFFGHGGYSADGLGQLESGNMISAEIPMGSTILHSYLYAATHGDDTDYIDIDFDGLVITLQRLDNNENLSEYKLQSYRADVTSKVISKVDNDYGIIDFKINNDSSNLDGVALVVIYQNSNLPETSIAILDGGLSSTESFTTVNLVEPIDKNDPKFDAILSLGISYSAQNTSLNGTHECGEQQPQSTIVEINYKILTSCAGNADDSVGITQDGNLITVGGIGDDTNNPSVSSQQPADGQPIRIQDDELYSLVPLLNNGDTKIVIKTKNPSEDDLVFLAIISTTVRASFASGEICGDGKDNDADGIIDENCEIDLIPPEDFKEIPRVMDVVSGKPIDVLDTNGGKYEVTFNTTSNVTNVFIDKDKKKFHSDVSGDVGTEGTLTVEIPRNMLDGIYEVKYDNQSIPFTLETTYEKNIIVISYNHNSPLDIFGHYVSNKIKTTQGNFVYYWWSDGLTNEISSDEPNMFSLAFVDPDENGVQTEFSIDVPEVGSPTEEIHETRNSGYVYIYFPDNIFAEKLSDDNSFHAINIVMTEMNNKRLLPNDHVTINAHVIPEFSFMHVGILVITFVIVILVTKNFQMKQISF